MVNIGAALFGVVGAWIVAIWLTASSKKIVASICVALYALLSAEMLSHVDSLIPGIAGLAIGGMAWVAFRQTLYGKAVGASSPNLNNGDGT